MPILDATFLISADRHPKRVESLLADLVAGEEPILVPVQAAIEFAAGTREPAAALRYVREAFVLVPCGPEIALEAARLARESLAAGTFPGWTDVQIGATARHEGMAVVTRNRRHFEPLGLEVIDHP